MDASQGEIIDNVGQRSPWSGIYGIDNLNAFRGEIIDNVGQQSPRSYQCENYGMNIFWGKVIDIVGQQSPRNEDIPRPPEPGGVTSLINLSQSVTQILASLGKDGCVNPRQGLAVISAYTDTWKDTMTARFNYQEERILGLESQLLESRNTVGKYQESFTRFRNEVTRLDDLVDCHERAFPKLRGDVETSLEKVNSVLNKVEEGWKSFSLGLIISSNKI